MGLLIGAFLMILFVALPLVITVLEIRNRKRKWVCPSCKNNAWGAFCGNCGTSVRAKPSYAGFRKRFASMVIDGLIMLVPVGMSMLIQSYHGVSRIEWWFSSLLGTLFCFVYILYYTARFGQTPGKYLVGIRIMTLKLKPIGVSEAVKREAVNLAQSLFTYAFFAANLFKLSEEKFLCMPWGEKASAVNEPMGTWLMWFGQIWLWSELLILLTNKKRRALHDYIAGTVVVDEKTLKKKLPVKYKFKWWK